VTVASALALLRRFWWLGLVAACLLLVFSLRMSQAETRAAEDRATAAHDAHRATIALYQAAQAAAARIQAENIERVRAEQQEITDEVVTDYRARIADVRARYERLRAARAATARSDTSGPALPGLPDTAVGVDGAARDSGLSAEERLTATETALRLLALQDWVRQQAGVPTNPATPQISVAPGEP
jgi:hypothetical protein